MKTMKPSRNQSQVKSQVEVKLAFTRVYSLEVKLSFSKKSVNVTERMPDRVASLLLKHPKLQQQPQLPQVRPRAKKAAELAPRLRTRSNFCRSLMTLEMTCAFAMKNTRNKENTQRNFEPKMTTSKRSCARHSWIRSLSRLSYLKSSR